MKHYKSFTCAYCGKVFESYMHPKFCSIQCKRAKKYNDLKEKKIEIKLRKYREKGDSNG